MNRPSAGARSLLSILALIVLPILSCAPGADDRELNATITDLLKPKTPAGTTDVTPSPDDLACSDPYTYACCYSLNAEYREVLAEAKECHDNKHAPQCALRTVDELACPCPTFVEATNKKALARLSELANRYAQYGCEELVICAAVRCPTRTSAVCEGKICRDQ